MPRPLRTILPAALILLAAFLTYYNALRAPFVFDDLSAIVDNPNIKRLWPLTRPLTTTPQTPIAARPIVSLTFAINFATTGLNPVSYRITNLLIHAGCAFLIFLLTRQSLSTPAVSRRLPLSTTTIDLLSLASALLFTLHPLNNECVNYTMQRTESLMGFFTLLALYCFAKGASSPAPHPPVHGGPERSPELVEGRSGGPRRSTAWYLAATTSCALAMGCKEVAVAAPLLILLYDRLFLSDSWRDLWKHHKLPHLALFSTYAVLIYLLWDHPRSATSHFDFPDLTPWNYLKTQAQVLVFYLRMVLWPHPLVIDYFDWPLAKSLLPILPTPP